jgi:hypothetical protein
MALNIKNEATVAKVKQVAQRFGTTYSAAVDLAADYALQAPTVTAEESRQTKARQIAASYRAHRSSQSPLATDSLYDEHGLFA